MPPPVRHPAHVCGRTGGRNPRAVGTKGCSRRGARTRRRKGGGGFSTSQRVNRTPPLQSHNPFDVLDIEQIIDPSISTSDCVKDVQTPPIPATRRKRIRAWERSLPKKYIIAAIPSQHSLSIDIEIEMTDTSLKRCLQALVDCGATGMFIDQKFVEINDIPTCELSDPIPVFNVDGTPNEAGMICEVVDIVLHFNDHSERVQLAVTQLGRQSVILGYTWLSKHNPQIDWQTKEVSMSRCPAQCSTCRLEQKQDDHQKKIAAAQIRACRLGEMPELIDDDEDDDEDDDDDDHGDATDPKEGVPKSQNPRNPFGLFADDDHDNDVEIEEGDRIFTATILPQDIHHFVCATSSTPATDLAAAYAKNAKVQSFRDAVPDHLNDFEDVFNKESFDSLPERRKWDHAIELEREPAPGFRKVYPMTLEEQAELDAFLEEALATGRIRPSKSPIGAPVFFVKKKDGKLRFVQDYRALNAITRKNRYPLPIIDDLINRLKGARYFSKLDVRWGYNNVRIKEGDEWKAAFRTNRGLFKPLVMYFGLTNSPATFQMMMNEIFQDLITQGVVSIYLDDILIFMESMEEHNRITHLVLEWLREYKLYLRHDKCEFAQTKIEYLGLIISHGQAEMDPVKIAGVAEWPIPTSKKEVQSFLGFTNFYHRFIEGFSHLARPLFDLTRNNSIWHWTETENTAFDHIRTHVTSAPILMFPDEMRPFRVEADSSDFATGAVLSQQSLEDDKWHPIAYYSKSLNAVERNYEIHDKEMLAVIRALEEWRHFLEGARHKFEIWTDHKNLEYFMLAKKLNRRQARWSLYLSTVPESLFHHPGRSMGKSDALS